jgi:hypothetical protein
LASVLGARRLVAAALTVAVVCGAAVGCGDDPEAERDPDGAGAEGATDTTGADDAGDAAVAAYEANWLNLLAAGDPPDPEAPALAEHATGEMLSHFQSTLEQYAAEGLVLRGTMEFDAEAVEVTEERAVVEDCGLDRTEVVVAATGEVANGSDDERDGVIADLVVEDGAWKVSFLREDPEVCG